MSDGIAAFSKLDDGRWGLAGYDPSTREFYFKIAGANLRWLTRCGSRLTAFVEGTAHGSLILGRFDIPTGSRRYLMETRGSIRLLDRESPGFRSRTKRPTFGCTISLLAQSCCFRTLPGSRGSGLGCWSGARSARPRSPPTTTPPAPNSSRNGIKSGLRGQGLARSWQRLALSRHNHQR